MKIRMLKPSPVSGAIGTTNFVLDQFWVGDTAAFGHVRLAFKTKTGHAGYFVYSQMFNSPEKLADAWENGFSTPTKGQARGVAAELVKLGLAAEVPQAAR